MKRKVKDYIVISLKGMAMGAADVVPGVSGGTIAFISGIYEELLGSISNVNLGLFKTLKNEGFKAAWKQLNGNFLLSLFIGIFISILSLAKAIKYLLETQFDIVNATNLILKQIGWHRARIKFCIDIVT